MQLTAEKRTELGKKAKLLRRERRIPCVIFGKGMESTPMHIGYTEFIRVYREAGDTSVIDLKLEGNTYPVMVKGFHKHPVSSEILHIDFYKVDLTKEVTVEVPIVVLNEEENELVARNEAFVSQFMTNIEVSALPNDIPDEVTIDVLNLSELGADMFVSDLIFDKEKVTIDVDPEELVLRLEDIEKQAQMAEIIEEEEELPEDLLAVSAEADADEDSTDSTSSDDSE